MVSVWKGCNRRPQWLAGTQEVPVPVLGLRHATFSASGKGLSAYGLTIFCCSSCPLATQCPHSSCEGALVVREQPLCKWST